MRSSKRLATTNVWGINDVACSLYLLARYLGTELPPTPPHAALNIDLSKFNRL